MPALAAGILAAGTFGVHAQSEPGQSAPAAIMAVGDAVVTGFSGATQHQNVEQRYIDLDGPSMRILSGTGGILAVSAGGGREAKYEVKAGQVGQVFGIALDDNAIDGIKAPNIYLAASSAFGIQTVKTGGDGQPERTTTGGPGTTFMDGQFGLIEGAGPGTIYKVDGVSGEVTVFANVTLDQKPNSGAGLGNVTFDAKTRQFFVSDLDTGMIHRIDLQGVPIDHFDHGVDGRSEAGLAPVEHDDANRMNIESPAFNSEDTATWGLAAPDRRVGGLVVHDGRLYYAVNSAVRQIWSVSLNPDGGFGTDVRLEIDVASPGGGAPPPMITDMTFDSQGRIYLAQRGGLKSSFDYSVFAPSGTSVVLRYAKDPAGQGWTPQPQDYAIGMAGNHQEAAGGVAIGNGPAGAPVIDGKSCRYLWSTGDKLKPDAVVHGIQGNDLELVRPANVPPVQATYVDYDGKPNPAITEGHAGDVEVLRACDTIVRAEVIPAFAPVPLGGGYLTPSHWKFGSDGHSKIRSHRKYGSWGHTKRRSHWKCASYGHSKRRSHSRWHSAHHSKRRSHWKFASSEHLKSRSHHKKGSHGHTKRRSHWKCFSHHHTKRRSHWKFASHVHTKWRSHWKHASRDHSKRRSHWKHASRDHSKLRSHYKTASRDHSKLRSHYKTASRGHSKLRSHYKTASREHSKLRSHYKTASREHSKLRSHYKSASRGHSKRRSHYKDASRGHSKQRSHYKGGSRGHHAKSRSHNRRISHGGTHRRRISIGNTHRRSISRGSQHRRRISAGRVPKRDVKRWTTRRQHRVQRLHRFRQRFNQPRMQRQRFNAPRIRSGGFGGRGFSGGRGFGGGGFRR